MLISSLWALSVRTRSLLRRCMPTNVMLDKLRTRRGLKWGVPAMVVGVGYIGAALLCFQLIESGWSEMLYLIFVICLWNGAKFLLFGPISVVLLARVRLAEHVARKRMQRAPLEPTTT